MNKEKGPHNSIDCVPLINRDTSTDQRLFEDSLMIECLMCKKHIKASEIRTHLYLLHNLNNHEIDRDGIIDRAKRVCPICKKAFGKPLKWHLRTIHFDKTHKFAKGIYDTETTYLKRKHDSNTKKIIAEKWRFERKIVSGGLPSLGRKRK